MYTDLEAKLHDTFWNQEDIISELPLLEKFHDHKVSLEIGCGSGRLLLPLLENGHPIDGVEISAEMVSILHTNAAKQALTEALQKQTIHTADIIGLELKKQYERVSIPAFTAQLLSRENFKTLLYQTHENSTTDGQLYFTIFIPWAEITGELSEGDWYLDHEASLENHHESKPSIAQCKTKFTINRLRQTLSRKHQYTVTHTSGKKQQHRSSQNLQWYSYPELELILTSTGWKTKQLVADLEPEKTPHPDAHILTVIAEKK